MRVFWWRSDGASRSLTIKIKIKIRMTKLKKNKLVVLGVVCPLVIIFVFQFVSRPQLAGWDEAGYILQGYRLNQALRSFDWPGLVGLTRNQVFYPFFQSWFLGLATLPLGYSISTARLVSLLLLWPLSLLFWMMAEELRPGSRWWPVVVLGLILSSPTILYFFSLAMMEGLGLLLTMICLWFYWRAREKGRPVFFFLTGLTAQAVIFTKYNYGLVLGALLALEGLIWFAEKKGYRKKKTWLSLFWLFAPILALSLWWFLLPGNKPIILGFIKSFNDYPASWLTHWLFYFFELALGYTFSWVAFLFLAIGFVWASVKNRRRLKVRSLVLLFLVNFLTIMLKSPNKNQARYLFTGVPAFLMVGSLGLFELWPKISHIRLKPVLKGIFLPFGALLAVILVRDLVWVPQMVRSIGSHHVGSPVFYEPDYQRNNRFNFNRLDWPRQSAPAGSEKIEDLFKFAFAQVDLSRRVIQVGEANEISPHLFNYYLAKAKEADQETSPGLFQSYLVVFEVKPGSHFDTQDFRQANWASAQWARSTLLDPSLTLVNQRHFPYLGIRVSVMGAALISHPVESHFGVFKNLF